MAMSPSSTTGRTPPFVLVGLVLLVLILGYNYWVLSSSNSSLSQENAKTLVVIKETNEKRMVTEKKLAIAKEEVAHLEKSLNDNKNLVAGKDKEINTLKEEVKKIGGERDTCKKSLTKCDEDLKVEKKNVENAKAGKSAVCSASDCLTHVKKVVEIAAKLAGKEPLQKALTAASLDATKLMEGIEVESTKKQK